MAESPDNPHEPKPDKRSDADTSEPEIHHIYELADVPDRSARPDASASVRSATALAGQIQHHTTSVGSAAAARTVGSTATAESETARSKKKKHVLTSPPRQRARLGAWVVMLVCLAAAAVPMLVDFQRPAVFHPAEARSLVTSWETWQRQAALGYEQWSLEALESLIPAYNGQTQLDATPGTTWLHLVAFQFLPTGPDRTPTEWIVLAGRAVSVACGLLTVAAIFWIGICIGNLRTATLAALVCTANPLLLYYSRLAGPEMPQVALATLTIAAAVWAIRPLKMAGSRARQAVGWLLCGVCMGMAILTGGAGTIPFMLAPIVFIFTLYPNRVGHLMGLVAAVIVAALLTTPWALYTHEQDAATWQAWAQSLVPSYFHDPALLDDIATDRLWLLLLATLPWTAWLAAGLIQPFSTSSAGARLRMFLGWVWFVPVALLLLGAPGEGTPREMLIVLPAAALLVGQVVRQYSDLSDEGRHTRIWRLLRWPHCFAAMFASVAIPLVGEFQGGMQRAGWLSGPVSMEMPMGYWLGLGAALLGIVVLSMRFAERHHPGRSVACWAVWVIVAASVVAVPVARGPLGETPMRDAGEVVARVTGDAPLYWLTPEAQTDDAQADARLTLYSRHRLRTIQPDQLAALHGEHEQFYIVTEADRALDASMRRINRFENANLALWQGRTEKNTGEQQTEEQETGEQETKTETETDTEAETEAGEAL